MKLLRRIIASLAFVALLATAAGGAWALETELPEQPLPNYLYFTGTVKEVQPYVDSDGNTVDTIRYVLTEDENGGLARLRVTEDTYNVTDKELRVGSEVTGYYDAKGVHLMIYPAQYEAKVLAVDVPEGHNVKVDTFDEELLSADQQLKLNISDETKVVLQNGEPYTGELAGKNLAVIYTFTTRSIPAQTSPIRVTVLENMDLVVDEIQIQSPATYIKADGTIMVPVRVIAEQLGYKVGWDYDARKITVNDSVSFVLGEDGYSHLEKGEVRLGTAPELVKENSYVPLNFFEKVIGAQQVELVEGKIVINQKNLQIAE